MSRDTQGQKAERYRHCMIFLCILFFVQGCVSLKVTDPTDPRFEAKNFRFEDYDHFTKFRDAMEALFPVGTSKQEVDHMLVELGGAGMADDGIKMKIAREVKDSERIVRYYKEDISGFIRCMFIVAAVYDQSDILTKKIDAYYGCK